MTDGLPESWGSEDEPTYAMLVADATPEIAKAAVESDFGPFEEPPLRYIGIRTVRIRKDDLHFGRLRRVHLFTDEPA